MRAGLLTDQGVDRPAAVDGNLQAVSVEEAELFDGGACVHLRVCSVLRNLPVA